MNKRLGQERDHIITFFAYLKHRLDALNVEIG